MMSPRGWLGSIVIVFYITACWGLTNVKVVIPVAVKRGERAILRCHYDLEGEQLYSVKWYKGGREFYRYTPRENPPKKQFPTTGLRVLLTDSNETHVVLDRVSMESSGPYMCEISADAPSFFTRVETGILQVVDVPREDPQITGVKQRYRLGEVLKAECTSRQSRPAANLTWLVNDEPVEQNRIRRHHLRTTENNALFNAHSDLRLQISQQLFSGGRLKIRCVASLHDIYHRSSEKSVELERQKHRTTTPASTISWEYALAAERYPQSTLIFTADSASPTRGSTSITSLSILILLLCAR